MTKQSIAWVTDSTAFITPELEEHPDVHVLPLQITFGTDSYEDGVNIDTDTLYQKIRASKEIPKTSQPPAGRFAELYQKLGESYDAVISVHISGELSGTCSSARQGADMTETQVEVVDSLSMSYAITSLIEEGMERMKEDEAPSQIAEALRESAARSENYILLGSLEQFHKGGRMSGAQYLIGSLLQVKPIIRITTEGKFDLYQKVRSEKKAWNRMLELLQEALDRGPVDRVQILHGNIPAKAEMMKQRIASLSSDIDIFIGEISSTIGVHAGEGTLALMWKNEKQQSE
ncbi:DegV family protein [Alkalicoccus chagannorensis]|uniref:DegV family protein n=1 Tax=Alkalicoccus chagannorensis TaxID=427072 RepID=UPI00047DC9DD|nr:DegV family protein [Alkalicoccus chagannorensis]